MTYEDGVVYLAYVYTLDEMREILNEDVYEDIKESIFASAGAATDPRAGQLIKVQFQQSWLGGDSIDPYCFSFIPPNEDINEWLTPGDTGYEPRSGDFHYGVYYYREEELKILGEADE
jgi:hypothetical protein